ncbi:MAG: hypothetical protein AB8B79_18220, partial [Granulosicoccus sp.]
MKRVFKWSGFLLLAILILFLLVLALVFGLAGTDAGFKQVTQAVSERVDGLDLGTINGNLTSGIETNNLSFENEGLAINANGVQSAWRLGCLMQRRFCLDKVEIDELAIATFPTDAPPPTSSDPIELPTINLPLDVTVDQVLVKKLIFQPPGDAAELVLENLSLSAKTEDNTLYLDNASLQYQNYDAVATGSINVVDDYPLDLSIELNADDILPDTVPEGDGAQPAKVLVKLGNTLKQLDVNTQVTGAANVSILGTVQPLDKDLPLQMSVSAKQLGWPITSQNQIRALDTLIELDGSLKDYQLKLFTQLEGEQVPDTTIDIDGLVNTERLSLPAIAIKTLGGTASGSTSLSWLETIEWASAWTLNNLNPGIQLPDLDGNLNGMINATGLVKDGQWTLDLPQLQITGELRELPFDLDVALAKDT